MEPTLINALSTLQSALLDAERAARVVGNEPVFHELRKLEWAVVNLLLESAQDQAVQS